MSGDSSTIQRDRILAAVAGTPIPVLGPERRRPTPEARVPPRVARRPRRTRDANSDYVPGASEFALPVQVIRTTCRASRPIVLRRHEGASPGTTLAGAFGTAVMDSLCLATQIGDGWCPVERADGGGCRVPGACPVADLRKPRSATLATPFPTPVFLSAPRLERGDVVENFELRIVLWGRRATRLSAFVETAIAAMAARGLSVDGTLIPFDRVRSEASPVRPLAECAGPPYRGASDRVTLLLDTPLVGFDPTWDALRGGTTCATDAAHQLVRGALAGVARDLVLWDTEDRGAACERSREARLELSRTAAQQAIDAFRAVEVEDVVLDTADLGRRRSRTNGRVFPLRGFTGRIELRGRLEPLWPWLAAASLARWGAKRGLGFGEVSVRVAPRFEPGPPRRSASMQRRLRAGGVH